MNKISRILALLLTFIIGHTTITAQSEDCSNTLLLSPGTAIIDGEMVSLELPLPEEYSGWQVTSNLYYTQQADDELTFYRVLPDGTTDFTVDMPLPNDNPQYTKIAPMPDEDFVTVSVEIINMAAEGLEPISTILLWVVDIEAQELRTTEPVRLEFEGMDDDSPVSLLDIRFSPDGSRLLVASITQPQEEQLGVMPTECLLDGSATCFVDIIDFDPDATRYNGYWLADDSGDIIHLCRGEPGICQANIETETIRELDMPVSDVRYMAYLPCENAIAGWQNTGNRTYSLFLYDLDDDTLQTLVAESERHGQLYTLIGDMPEFWLDE